MNGKCDMRSHRASRAQRLALGVVPFLYPHCVLHNGCVVLVAVCVNRVLRNCGPTASSDNRARRQDIATLYEKSVKCSLWTPVVHVSDSVLQLVLVGVMTCAMTCERAGCDVSLCALLATTHATMSALLARSHTDAHAHAHACRQARRRHEWQPVM